MLRAGSPGARTIDNSALTKEQTAEMDKHWRRAILLDLSRARSPERCVRRLAKRSAAQKSTRYDDLFANSR